MFADASGARAPGPPPSRPEALPGLPASPRCELPCRDDGTLGGGACQRAQTSRRRSCCKEHPGGQKKNTLVPQNWDHFWIQNWGPFLLYLYVGVTANWVAFGSPLLGPQNPSDKFLGVRRQTPRRGAFRPSQTNCHSAAPRWRSWQICELTPRATRLPLGPSPKKDGDCTRIRLSKIKID